MSLSQVGVNSLLAVNQWIGMINSNLISASRTGYKTSRISFSDGLGVNSVSGDDLFIPPSTLSVQATTIEWGQGSVINSDQQTHFAIQGEGFFVLHDKASNKYFLSRDGEFHWGNEGFLVNSAGLRVVSNGHDYVRMGTGDDDYFDGDNVSVELNRFGNKSFLLLDVLNRDNLRMSQYGSTVFELDGAVTTRVKNDLNKSTDGLSFVYDDPSFISVVDDPGFVTVPNPPLVPDTDFSINFGANGVFDFSTVAGSDFLPTAFSIQDIVDVINIWGSSAAVTGIAGNAAGRVIATYDELRDVLIIENRVGVTNINGTNNGVSFGGVNGDAIRRFFRMNNNDGASDELSTPTFQSNIFQSTRDIDNSALIEYKDVGYNGVAVGRPSYPATTLISNLLLPQPQYTHVKGANGYVEASALGGASIIIGEATATDKFDIVMDMKISSTDPLGAPATNAPPPVAPLMIFNFGQTDPHSQNSGGFELVYNPTATPINIFNASGVSVLPPGAVVLRQRPSDYEDTSFPVLISTPQILPQIGVAAAGLNASPTHRVAFSLNGDKQLTMSIDGVTASFAIGGGGQSISGHLTMRNNQSVMQIHSLYADFKQSNNASTTGEMVPVSLFMTSTVDQGEYVNRPRSRVVQAALESSTASLTEYVPMLSLAQKVFSAISKIISTHNNVVDDMNTLLR